MEIKDGKIITEQSVLTADTAFDEASVPASIVFEGAEYQTVLEKYGENGWTLVLVPEDGQSLPERETRLSEGDKYCFTEDKFVFVCDRAENSVRIFPAGKDRILETIELFRSSCLKLIGNDQHVNEKISGHILNQAQKMDDDILLCLMKWYVSGEKTMYSLPEFNVQDVMNKFHESYMRALYTMNTYRLNPRLQKMFFTIELERE